MIITEINILRHVYHKIMEAAKMNTIFQPYVSLRSFNQHQSTFSSFRFLAI